MSTESLSLEEQLERVKWKKDPPKPPCPDSFPFGSLVEAYEMWERFIKERESLVQAWPQLWSALTDIRESMARTLALFGPWIERFQGIADRDFEGAELDSRILRRMRARISESHPELDTAGVNALLLPTAYDQLLAGGGDSGHRSANEKWMRVSEAATATCVSTGKIWRAVNRGELPSNGKDGHERRIEASILMQWALRRNQRPEQAESDAAVEAKIKRHCR
jgi:hypothetical protein